LVRWLVSDVPNRTELLAQQNPSDPDQAVSLQVRVRDEKFQPLENCAVSILVQPIGSSGSVSNEQTQVQAKAPIRLTAEPSLSEPGLYQATYIPRETGGYWAQSVVTNSVGAEIGRAEAGWTSDPSADEFRSLTPNHALMAEVAKKSGGEVVALKDLDSFVAHLPQKKAPITENWTFPIWHQPAVFLFALACFVAEWGLRRWKGLA
jgi:hypothetical protein